MGTYKVCFLNKKVVYFTTNLSGIKTQVSTLQRPLNLVIFTPKTLLSLSIITLLKRWHHRLLGWLSKT
jgi:hypothetical protein